MPRASQYSDDQKTKIIQAARSALKKGKWSDALEAAKGKGFKGGLAYLTIMVGRKGRKRGPGRAQGTGKRGPGRPSATLGLQGIDRVVQRMVEQKTGAVLRNALAALKQATAALEKAL
jgi:hypothetical protein